MSGSCNGGSSGIPPASNPHIDPGDVPKGNEELHIIRLWAKSLTDEVLGHRVREYQHLALSHRKKQLSPRSADHELVERTLLKLTEERGLRTSRVALAEKKRLLKEQSDAKVLEMKNRAAAARAAEKEENATKLVSQVTVDDIHDDVAQVPTEDSEPDSTESDPVPEAHGDVISTWNSSSSSLTSIAEAEAITLTEMEKCYGTARKDMTTSTGLDAQEHLLECNGSYPRWEAQLAKELSFVWPMTENSMCRLEANIAHAVFDIPLSVRNAWTCDPTITDLYNTCELKKPKVVKNNKKLDKGDKGTKPVDSPVKTPLSKRAMNIARSMRGDMYRLRKFIEASYTNLPWCRSVMQKFRELYCTTSCLIDKSKFGRVHKQSPYDTRDVSSPGVVAKLEATTSLAVRVLATDFFVHPKDEQPVDLSDTDPEDSVEVVETMVEEGASAQEVKTLCNKISKEISVSGNGDTMCNTIDRDLSNLVCNDLVRNSFFCQTAMISKTCIYCAIGSRLLDDACRDHFNMYILRKFKDYADSDYDRNLEELVSLAIKNNSERDFLAYSARLHNKQQHAKNGNISFDAGDINSREAENQVLVDRAWDAPTIVDAGSRSDEGYLVQADQAISTCSFRFDLARIGLNGTIMGTNHSLFADLGAYLNCDLYRAWLEGNEPECPPNDEIGRALVGREDREYILTRALITQHDAAAAGIHAQRWYAIGTRHGVAHGKLTKTTQSINVMVNLNDAAQTGVLLNDQRAYNVLHYLSGEVQTAESVAKFMEHISSDWRALGLKIALYDDLRSRAISQPSGVEWAWAEKTMPIRNVVFSVDEDLWSFKAIFISGDYLESCVRYGGVIRVAQMEGQDDEDWSIFSHETQIIGVDACTTHDIQKAIWAVSHLTYPLVHVFEDYGVTLAGRAEVISRKCFEKNASCVSFRDDRRKLIFVTNSETNRVFSYDVHQFPIQIGNRHGAQAPPAIRHDVNAMVRKMVRDMVDHPLSLRVEFDRAFSSMFSGGGNWLEVDMLVAALTIRFPPRIEGRAELVANDVRRRYQGIAREANEFLARMTLTGDPIDMTAYGKSNCVNCLDMGVSDRETAENFPVIYIGYWPAVAEIALTFRLAMYDVFNTESSLDIQQRRLNCGLDRIQRACYLRRSVENFKREAGITDGIVHPALAEDDRIPIWLDWIQGAGEVKGLHEFIKCFIGGGKTDFSWEVNIHCGVQATWTGIRTSSDMWISERNKKTHQIAIETYGLRRYDMQGDWRMGQFHQVTDMLSVSCELEQHLMRIDVDTAYGSFNRCGWPGGIERDLAVSWVVHGTTSGRTAMRLGWSSRVSGCQGVRRIWGWGLTTLVKNWEHTEVQTLGLKEAAYALLCSRQLIAGLWLAGPAAPDAAPTISASYIYKPLGLKHLPTNRRHGSVTGADRPVPTEPQPEENHQPVEDVAHAQQEQDARDDNRAQGEAAVQAEIAQPPLIAD
nr:coat protein [Nilaparvata lugens toti-like virus 1]